MSVVEYLRLLDQCSKEIVWQSESEWLKLIYGRFIPDGSVDDITDVITLLNKLEEKNLLGIDRLKVLKELLKGIRKWDLLRILERFEMKRKEYRQLLEQISHALEESNELQRLILICRRKNLVAHQREEHIKNVDALFAELEQQHELGIEDLGILKTIATEMEKPDLCRLVEEFEKKRKQEEDAERERIKWEDNKRRAGAGAALVLSGIVGRRLIGAPLFRSTPQAADVNPVISTFFTAVTPHCTFHNLVGGTVVVTTLMVLRKSRNMEEFTNAFKETVLPLGNFLRAIGEGSIRFTIQAENIFALDALWQSYQDETLQTNLQEFLVTEEIEQLTGGEVRLTVYIDEDEYRNARLDLMISGIEEMKLEEERGLKERASSDSDLLKERNMTTANTRDPFPEREFLPFDRKLRVEEYLENLQETSSEFTLPSDSGVGTLSSATSEYGFDKGDRLEKLDQVEGLIKDVSENWDSIQEAYRDAYRDAYPFEGRKYRSIGKMLENIRMTLGTWRKMEKEWIIAEPILTSSSRATAVIQQLKNSLQLDQGFFKNPTREDKRAIRVLARKAKNLKRFDVFNYLKMITPPGTTGPLLPENMLIKEMPRDEIECLSKFLNVWSIAKKLDLRLEMMRSREGTFLMDALTNRHDLRTVGELYDFLCERGLPEFADFILK
ncbi:unnamed protein product [Pocillopora meandrina]|uniref:DED domain-containing protein n=1 Tax=Pocillopora meandrina TaxID=46732 RepID=A0AAU9XT40_9CNID|nr:unnamed protein product [Pocillopora meandrina]